MKKTIKCYLHYQKTPYSKNDGFEVWDMEMTGDDSRILVTSLDVVFDVPDDFDPRPAQIAALKEKQTKAATAFYAMNNDLMRQIGELEAICFDEVTA